MFRRDVRFGSIASVWMLAGDFRSSTGNGHHQRRSTCLKSAKTGSDRTHSITRSARAGKADISANRGTPHFTDGSRFVTVQYIGTFGYRGNPAAASSLSKGANVECARKWLRRTPGKLANNRSTVVSRSSKRPNLVRQMTTYPCEGRCPGVACTARRAAVSAASGSPWNNLERDKAASARWRVGSKGLKRSERSARVTAVS
jgi:hypothetical protein